MFNKNLVIIYLLGIGDWGLGIGDWGLGIGDWAQSPIPNPQSPIPNPQKSRYFILNYFKLKIKIYFNNIFIKIIIYRKDFYNKNAGKK